MTLHHIFTEHPSLWQQLNQLAQSHDSLLFLGNGLYRLQQQIEPLPQTCYYRASDADARGLTTLPTFATAISDTEWVALTLSHARTMSWK